MNRPLYLASHVRTCAHDGQIILLDLRRSRYLGVAGARFGALASLVTGWPDPQGISQIAPVAPNELAVLAAPLLRQGLLTPVGPNPLADPGLPPANQSLNADDVIDEAPAGAARTLRFMRSGAAVGLRLRLRSLQWIAHDVASRRARAPTFTHRAHQPLRTAVATYLRLRPLMFTAHDRCLHDSLSLLGFLAAERWYPHWVIGVASQPFRAHAWVQSGDMAISDLHENVRRYTPILVA